MDEAGAVAPITHSTHITSIITHHTQQSTHGHSTHIGVLYRVCVDVFCVCVLCGCCLCFNVYAVYRCVF